MKNTLSKTLIIFLCVILLVFNYDVNRPKAIGPLVGWGLAILGGIVAEQMVTMGVKGASKAVLKKQANNYSENMHLQGKFDWEGLNPYRNKDGSITLSPKANDRAKMAGLIAGGLTGMAFGPDGEPLQNPLASCFNEYGEFSGNASLIVTPIRGVGADSGKMFFYANGEQIYWNGMGDSYWDRYVPVQVGNVTVTQSSQPGEYILRWNLYDKNGDLMQYGGTSSGERITDPMGVFQANNASLCTDGELAFPSTMKNVYPAPMDMSSAYKMPNDEYLKQPIIIYNVLPPGEEGPISFPELEEYFSDDPSEFERIVEQNTDNILDDAIINLNPYTVEEINNYYTDINFPIKVDDFEPGTGLPDNPDDNLPTVPDDNLPGEPVKPLDKSMFEMVKQTYGYLATSIDTAISSMKAVTDGAVGLVNYLDQAMRWLPAEWRGIFASAFILGVFAHFMRR